MCAELKAGQPCILLILPVPLADLVAGLKENTEVHRSAIFVSLGGSKAEDASGAQDCQRQAAVTIAVSYNGNILKEAQPERKEKADEAKASLSSEAEDTEYRPKKPSHAYPAPQAGKSESQLIQEVKHHDFGDGQKWTPPHSHPQQELGCTDHLLEAMATLTPEVIIHRDPVDGQKCTPPHSQAQEKMECTQQAGETMASLTPDNQSCAKPQLRHRREEPLKSGSVGGRKGILSQSSISTSSKQKRKAPRGGRSYPCGSCFVDNLLQCAQVVVLTVLVHHAYLEWF